MRGGGRGIGTGGYVWESHVLTTVSIDGVLSNMIVHLQVGEGNSTCMTQSDGDDFWMRGEDRRGQMYCLGVHSLGKSGLRCSLSEDIEGGLEYWISEFRMEFISFLGAMQTIHDITLEDVCGLE
ncbi:hypothetical protein Tco_0762141 [Tanacetum coccineum]